MQDQFSNIPKSRDEARERGLKVLTGIPCVNGHIAPRYVSTGNCVKCQVEHARRNGGWGARPSKDEYLRMARQLVEDKGGVLLSIEYVSAKSKLKVRCGGGHEFASTYDSLKHGRWCPTCKRENHAKRMAAKLRPVEDLRAFARSAHGGDCLAEFPVSVLTKVLWKCRVNDHAPFLATPAHVMNPKNQTWCPACDAERRRLYPPNPQISRDEVERLVEERGGEIVPVPGGGNWKGLRTRLRIRCADGHEWDVSGNNLMHRGSWCPECRHKGERITRAIFEATFRTEFPKCNPSWLASATGRRLELDGYGETLQLAFEYQGPHHFTEDNVKATDTLKREACMKHGVRLVEIEAIKRPFPPESVLAKVAAALQNNGFSVTPILPATDVFARELEALRQLASQKGGTLVTKTFCGSEPHEWQCGNPDHPTWLAEPWRVRRGAWCPSCAGNRKLGIDGLRAWGETVGLELLDTDYRGTKALYEWRCKKTRHTIRRSRGNIQESLNRGLPACNLCGSEIRRSALIKKERADEFAMAMLPIIENVRKEGVTSLTAIADQLNKRGIATAKAGKWYASTVKNILERLAEPLAKLSVNSRLAACRERCVRALWTSRA
jgi:hypothetical protein